MMHAITLRVIHCHAMQRLQVASERQIIGSDVRDQIVVSENYHHKTKRRLLVYVFHWTPCELFRSVFSRPRSKGWPYYGCTFLIYLCPLSFRLTLPQGVLSASWCCPSRSCVVFLAFVHLTLFLALSLTPSNSLVSSWCDKIIKTVPCCDVYYLLTYLLTYIICTLV